MICPRHLHKFCCGKIISQIPLERIEKFFEDAWALNKCPLRSPVGEAGLPGLRQLKTAQQHALVFRYSGCSDGDRNVSLRTAEAPASDAEGPSAEVAKGPARAPRGGAIPKQYRFSRGVPEVCFLMKSETCGAFEGRSCLLCTAPRCSPVG